MRADSITQYVTRHGRQQGIPVNTRLDFLSTKGFRLRRIFEKSEWDP